MRLTALVVVSRQIQRDAVRHLSALERHGLDELDVGAVLATLANQRGRIVEIAQELSAATPHSRGGEDVALRALVPLDQLLHVHLEEDLPDGRGVLLVGEVGGDLPDSDGRGVQDGLTAVELVVQEVCRVPRRVGVAEDATCARCLFGASEGDHHAVFVAGLAAGAIVGSAGLAGEHGEWERRLDGLLLCLLVGGRWYVCVMCVVVGRKYNVHNGRKQ
jgi:hypothetical protein